MPLRPLAIVSWTSLFLFALGASASAHDCHSHHARYHERESLVLNGKLNTADFNGGVGQYAVAEEDYGYGSGYGYQPSMMMFGRSRGHFGFFGFHSHGFHSHGFGFHSGGFGMHGGHR
jgi:hypothetical protein